MNSLHITNRQASLERAVASARRLNAKYGRSVYAVIWDDMGIKGFIQPYAVVTSTAVVGR